MSRPARPKSFGNTPLSDELSRSRPSHHRQVCRWRAAARSPSSAASVLPSAPKRYWPHGTRPDLQGRHREPFARRAHRTSPQKRPRCILKKSGRGRRAYIPPRPESCCRSSGERRCNCGKPVEILQGKYECRRRIEKLVCVFGFLVTFSKTNARFKILACVFKNQGNNRGISVSFQKRTQQSDFQCWFWKTCARFAKRTLVFKN